MRVARSKARCKAHWNRNPQSNGITLREQSVQVLRPPLRNQKDLGTINYFPASHNKSAVMVRNELMNELNIDLWRLRYRFRSLSALLLSSQSWFSMPLSGWFLYIPFWRGFGCVREWWISSYVPLSQKRKRNKRAEGTNEKERKVRISRLVFGRAFPKRSFEVFALSNPEKQSQTEQSSVVGCRYGVTGSFM